MMKNARHTFESNLRNQIGFQPLARSDISKDFFIEELYRLCLDVGQNFRKEQIKKLNKEGADEFFEQAIVVSHDVSSHLKLLRGRFAIGNSPE